MAVFQARLSNSCIAIACLHAFARFLLVLELCIAIVAAIKAEPVEQSSQRLCGDDNLSDTKVILGNRLYQFARIRTTARVDTGDVSPDKDGHVDRDLLLIPIPNRPNVPDVERLNASPSRRFLILEWKYCVGVNGMALYRQISPARHDGSLRYHLLLSNLTARIEHGIGVSSRSQFLRIRAWHGKGDRYLDFIEVAGHSSEDTSRGSYDTATGRIHPDPPPVIGPHTARLPGEHFPETRWRRLKAAQVDRWNYAQVRYAINEIYARHNRVYDTPETYRYFSKFDWFWPGDGGYVSRAVTESEELSRIERANLLLLKARRNNLLSKPAGREDEND